MNIKSAHIAILISIVALAVSVYAIMGSAKEKKYAYVRSADLINGYIGVKEAKNVYQSKTKSWTASWWLR